MAQIKKGFMDAEALTGKVLGTCMLQELIGRGGMGAVFLAQQSRPRRQVAVKVLLPLIALEPYQQAAFLERFRRETDAIALLVHPNIVPVHEYGEQDGVAYLVMPYISGGTLRDELEREGKLSLIQAVSYLEQMSAALNCAHERGVIHRDVKPANILLTPEKRLVLTDFGLVKIITHKRRDQKPLSGPGMPMGTPDYMSPEQVVGQEIDARADLYSLGVILYQMVTGVVPFKGEMPMKVAMHHLETPPPSPRTLRPDLPASAESVILRALAKKPEDRYAHTHDLAHAFRQALESEGVVLADVPGNVASLRTIKKDRNMSNRQRSLFDPLWRGDQSRQAHDQLQSPKQEDEMENQPTNELPQQEGGKSLPYMPSSQPAESANANSATPVWNSLLSRNRLRPERKTTLLSEDWGNSASNLNNPSAANAPNATQGREQVPALSPAAASMLNPTGNVGLLSSYANSPAQSVEAQGHTPTAFPPGIPNSTRQLNPLTPQNDMQSWPSSTGLAPLGTFNAAQQNSYQPEATGSFNLSNAAPGTTGMLRTQTGALIPVNPPGVTGALMIPSGDESTGQTGMLKLTQSVKVVKVPLPGQPGQYVTGLLPVIPSAKDENAQSEPQGDTSLKGRIQKNAKALILIAAVVVLLFGSVIFLVARSATSTQGQTKTVQPDKAAIAAAQASATAQANLIVADPLTSNIHGWPSKQDDTGIYTFDNGEYRITATSDKYDAVALLRDVSVADKFVYTLSLNEVNGLDNSTDARKVNTFGLLFRLSRPDDQHLSYYAFLIDPNSAKPTYEFQKYDSTKSGDQRTSLWTQKIGGEYHLEHKTNNIIKIAADGSHFTFNVNGKEVGSKDDNALTAGQIGMIVNLKDTEIAFSNLRLTYR
jgi:serine/threonine protein kinase